MTEAKETAKKVRILINRIAREKAKYGCNFLLISQSLSDFKGEAKIVREMINSRFFLRASDKAELEYIQDYVSKEATEIVKNLKQGEVLVHGYAISAASGTKVYVRPPFSQVGELSEGELRKISWDYGFEKSFQLDNPKKDSIERFRSSFDNQLTDRENTALKIIREYYKKNNKPISAIELGNKMGLQGGSRQRIIDTLIHKKLVKTINIPNIGRGRPIQGIKPIF